jgi:RimJ/RimL family protein N-acetyltransferase
MWKPIDGDFFARRTPVEIADCGGVGGLGRLARDLIEELGGTAHLHLCGTPGDFLKVISQGERAAPYLVILAHGDENGLVFGKYADFIDTSMLVEGSMPPRCIAEHADLPRRVVFNDACGAGEVPMAQAFMAGGLKAYIGSVEPTPDGTAGIMFIAHFFYKLWRTKCSERDAWEQAASYDKDSRLYAFWDEDGGHQIGYVEAVCTAETFRPQPSEGLRWWRADEWEAFCQAHENRWPGSPFWSEDTWRQLHSEGYRYCSLLANGKAVAVAGLWPRTEREWEVIGLSTAPDHRSRGYGKAIASFVTQKILGAGKVAVLSYKRGNEAMRRIADALGYRPR